MISNCCFSSDISWTEYGGWPKSLRPLLIEVCHLEWLLYQSCSSGRTWQLIGTYILLVPKPATNIMYGHDCCAGWSNMHLTHSAALVCFVYACVCVCTRALCAQLCVWRWLPCHLHMLSWSFRNIWIWLVFMYVLLNSGSKLTHGVASVDENLFSGFLGERSAFLLDFIGSFDIPRYRKMLQPHKY